MKSVLTGLVFLLLVPTVVVAQVPPDAEWRVIESDHFRVTFATGMESLAAHAIRRAEAAHAILTANLAAAPSGKIDILLTDFVDLSNGSATPFPSNRIVIHARPPVDETSLAYFGDWIDLVVTHELAHIFHLDRAAGLGSVLRSILGRPRIGWPLFPAVGTPGWSVEGLATFIESELTGTGRVHGSYHDMVLRTAVLEDAFDSIDRVTGAGPSWPGASKAYIYGSIFADYLSKAHGSEVHGALVDRAARTWIPPSLAFDRVAKQTTGRSFSDAFEEWRAELEVQYYGLADSLRSRGLTESERLTLAGYQAAFPRSAPDGRVAFAAHDGRSAPAIRILDPETGLIRTLSRRNGLDGAAWLPDGSLLTAQLELDGPYRIYRDLYRIDPGGKEHRLTRGARLSSPDATRDGRLAVAVQGIGGTNRLVLYDLEAGTLRPLTEPEPDVHWAFPRWAPDGERIAAGRWRGGSYDVVVLDTLGSVLHALSDDRAVDTAPTWSPDGRYVLFSSDRSGIANLYAYDLHGEAGEGRLRQVTNVLTGAYHPDVSPDGRWIYFAGYRATGFHIERIAFDPESWREPAPLESRFQVATRAQPDDTNGTELPNARPYSAWPTLLPRGWMPVIYREGGTFLGAITSGQDLVGRHVYGLSAAYNLNRRVVDAGASYAYSGLGNPVLGLELGRTWEELGIRTADAPRARVMSREDGVSLSATLQRRRWRSSASLRLGVERVNESWHLFDAPDLRLTYSGTTFDGLFASLGYSSAQRHPFSISSENGVSVSVNALRRRDRHPVTGTEGDGLDRSYDEASVAVAAYPAFRAFGFANHVVALRAAARGRWGVGATPFGIGGAAGGTTVSVLGARIGGTRHFLPVRAFDDGVRHGTRAWAASLEYRVPIAMIDRGHRLWPIYLDRLSASAFIDTGDAWCSDDVREAFSVCPTGGTVAPLIGAGAELALDVEILYGTPARLRLGFAQPVRGGTSREPVLYLLLGPSF